MGISTQNKNDNLSEINVAKDFLSTGLCCAISKGISRWLSFWKLKIASEFPALAYRIHWRMLFHPGPHSFFVATAEPMKKGKSEESIH